MKRRTIALVLALCMLAGAFWGAPSAKAAGTVMYIVSNTLRFYSSPTTSSNSLGVLGYGTALLCTATSGEWAQVKNSSGATGYCDLNALSTSDPNTMQVPAYVNTDRAPIYKVPDASTAVWTRLKLNASFTAVAMTKDNQWVRLQNGKNFGYIEAKYLSTASAGPAPAMPPPAAPETGPTGTVYVTAIDLPVYMSADASSKCLGHMYYGQSMSCAAVSGDWATVQNGSATGYCLVGGLSLEDPNNLSRTVYINTDGAPIYKKPVAGAAVWTRLKLNASFTAVAVTPDGAWTRLQNGSYFGYIPSQYISDVIDVPTSEPTTAPTEGPSPANGTVYAIENLVPLRQSADAASRQLAAIPYGEALTLTGLLGDWAQVTSASGASGFCEKRGLSASDPNTLSRTVVINTDRAPIYHVPDASAGVWTTVRKNASYPALAVTPDGQWFRLQNGKYIGYIPSQYVSDPAAATPPPAAPETGPTGTVYVTAIDLPVYMSADASSKCLGHMYYGQSMSCAAVSGDWATVQNGSATGYCLVGGLSLEDPNNLSRTVYINTDGAPIYKKPVAGAAVWTRLKLNASFTAVAVTPDGAWTRLQNGSYFGYIPSQYISDVIDVPTPAPTATPAPSAAYGAANLLTVYASASQSANSLGTISYGEAVTLLNTSGVWAQVQLASGAVGYCAASGLTTADPNTYSQTVYIVTENAPIYKVPSTDTKVWTKLKKNAGYLAVAITPDGQWFRLQNGSYFGYIESKHVSAMMDEGNRTVYVTDTVLPVYAEASTSSRGLGNMYFGQSLTLIGSGDGWAKVMNSSGATGYCLAGGLTNVNPNTLNKPYYAKSNSVKLYSKPASGAKTVATVAQDTSLMVACMSADGAWARVALSDGGFAYVPMSELSETKINDETLISDIAPVEVYVVPTTLSVYAATSTASKLLGTMSFGEAMTCTGRSSAWARVVNAAGAVGYCDVNSITTTNPNAYATPLYAQVNGAKVYSKPLTSSTILSTLSLNATVTGVCYNSDRSWYRVSNGSAYGYVQAAFFATTPIADSGQSGKIGDVISLAKQYLGVPYVYGGQSPNGFDCSGLVYYCFKNAAGITLKRTAYTQGYDDNYPKITNKVDLKAGDVVFFDTVSDSDACDHAGIYLGNNQFIHASSGGGKVMISSLGSSTKDYYFRVYSWARRIIQ